jgi:ferritin-like metal-binding protein YciE
MAAIKTMHQAFLHELSDQYSCEKQLTDAMQSMLELSQNPQVQAGLRQHLDETAQQIKNLDKIFTSLGETREDVTCKGAAGIIGEFKSTAKEIKEQPLLEGCIAAGGLKGEHYEIASYEGLIGKAQLMGHTDAVRLLKENLQMEERFAKKLEQLDQELGLAIVSDMPDLVGHDVPAGRTRRMSR